MKENIKENNKKIAVIGATGNVGRKVISMLIDDKLVLAKNLSCFASRHSVGKVLNVNGDDFLVKCADDAEFSEFDICIFNTESNISQKLVPKAIESGAYVVDSSSYYRLEDSVPLIVPAVNSREINKQNKLYAHANCLTSPISTVISPLHEHNTILRVNATTYQSTSGAGFAAQQECLNETESFIKKEDYVRKCFDRQIAFNVIPQIGEIMDDGFTFEEYKIIQEVKKVVDKNISITATSVRVPVLVGHSIVLSIEFSKKVVHSDIVSVLKTAHSVQLSDNNYSTPIEVVGSDSVFVGRIRLDPSVANGVHLWLCSDNLRVGAARDSVEIARGVLSII